MNLVRKILLVHSDAKIRRRCAMLLAPCGFDIRLASSSPDAEDAVRSEWFDLAVLKHNLPDAPDLDLAERLRQVQPTLAIMLLVEQLEFPLVAQGIRQGVRDVIKPTEDLAPIVARVCAYFEVVPSLDAGGLSDELRQAEAVLDCLGGVDQAGSGTRLLPQNVPTDLIQAAREMNLLEEQLLRIAHERNTLEVQLRTLLAQAAELSRVQADAATLRSQRGMIAAARSAIEGNARTLAEQRADLAREREAVNQERRRLDRAGDVPDNAASPSSPGSKLHLPLHNQPVDQAERLRIETEQLARERAQFAAERQTWHKDLETLRDEEDNLRRYESRLRELQADLESERLALSAAQQARTIPDDELASNPSESAVRDSWSKFQRATEIFEAERAHLREDRLALRDWELALKQREDAAAAKEKRLTEGEKPAPKSSSPLAPQTTDSTLRSITRAPFEAAKAVLRSKK